MKGGKARPSGSRCVILYSASKTLFHFERQTKNRDKTIPQGEPEIIAVISKTYLIIIEKK